MGHNRVARMALNAPSYTPLEMLRGDIGWSTFKNIRGWRLQKASMPYTRQPL